MQNSNEATQRFSQQHTSPTSKYQFFENARYNTAHIVLEGEPAVKLHAKNVEVGTSANGNQRQDHVTMGKVQSSESTNH